ncbi:MAG: PIG-L deacetylase family protein [Planctomycetota bacterium]|jgi:LmbE family N-acetylglucosaminyl deacetylase
MALIRAVEGLASLRGCARRVLAVFPHPDDEAYGCAGTLARAGADPEAAAVLFCVTRGEASSMGPARGLRPAEVGDLRERRLEQVAAILRLDGLVVGDFPDGGLDRSDARALAAAVRRVIEAFRPQVLIGHDPRGVNAHPDHIATHWATRHALAGEDAVRFAMLAYPPSVAEAARPRLLFPTPLEEIDAVLHLTPDEIEAKERCLRIHEALVTLQPGGDGRLLHRPPVERYDFLGEERSPPVSDLFA